MLVLVLAIAGAVVGIALLARHDEAAVRAEWQGLLSPRGLQALERLEARFRAERRALAFTVDEEQLVDVGARYLAELVPERLRLLQLVARYARMVSAIRPGPRPRLRITELSRTLRALARARGSAAAASLHGIDRELVENCRALVEDLAGVRKEGVQ